MAVVVLLDERKEKQTVRCRFIPDFTTFWPQARVINSGEQQRLVRLTELL